MNMTPTGDDAATRFLQISPYVREPDDLQPALAGEHRCDVVVVGGGYNGLSTAIALRKAGVSVAVIEKEFSGFGASGRNAGHLTPTVCKDMPTAIMLLGKETAAKLARFGDHCVQTSQHMINQYRIDCDYHASGNIMAVVHPQQEKRLRRAALAARELGVHMRFIEHGEMRERGLAPTFLSGALEEIGGTLHPGKLIMGLRRCAIDAGVRLYEKSPAVEVQAAPEVLVRTASGSVKADKLVLTTNAYTPEIGPPGQYVMPFYVTMFETLPLSDAQLEAIGGWKGREGIMTAHESMESFRLTAQRTIIGGCKFPEYFYGARASRHGGEADSAKAINLNALRERFPQLHDLRFAHSWGGFIGMTLNFLPIVGQSPKSPSLYYSVAFNGHGVAQGMSMGEILADKMLGKLNPWHEIIMRRPWPTGPEPVRWLMLNAVQGFMNRVDKRYDQQLRSRRI